MNGLRLWFLGGSTTLLSLVYACGDGGPAEDADVCSAAVELAELVVAVPQGQLRLAGLTNCGPDTLEVLVVDTSCSPAAPTPAAPCDAAIGPSIRDKRYVIAGEIEGSGRFSEDFALPLSSADGTIDLTRGDVFVVVRRGTQALATAPVTVQRP